jgi:hypothetical protein
VQHDDGRWEVIGLPGRKRGDPLERLEGFGELQIEKARLAIRSPRLKVDMRIPRVDARLRVSGPRLLAACRPGSQPAARRFPPCSISTAVATTACCGPADQAWC